MFKQKSQCLMLDECFSEMSNKIACGASWLRLQEGM